MDRQCNVLILVRAVLCSERGSITAASIKKVNGLTNGEMCSECLQ